MGPPTSSPAGDDLWATRAALPLKASQASRQIQPLGWTLVAVACGFSGGIVPSEIIGIVGVLVFHQAIGITFLPVYLAVISGAGAPLASLFGRRRD